MSSHDLILVEKFLWVSILVERQKSLAQKIGIYQRYCSTMNHYTIFIRVEKCKRLSKINSSLITVDKLFVFIT